MFNFYLDISSKVISTNYNSYLIRTKFNLGENYTFSELCSDWVELGRDWVSDGHTGQITSVSTSQNT